MLLKYPREKGKKKKKTWVLSSQSFEISNFSYFSNFYLGCLIYDFWQDHRKRICLKRRENANSQVNFKWKEHLLKFTWKSCSTTRILFLRMQKSIGKFSEKASTKPLPMFYAGQTMWTKVCSKASADAFRHCISMSEHVDKRDFSPTQQPS